MWALTSGVRIDHRPVDFERHRYLLAWYLENGQTAAFIKAAQVGASMYSLLYILWWLKSHQGTKGIFYLPNRDLAENMSKDRLNPIIESCPDIHSITANDGKLGLRHIGTSSLYISYLGGNATKDSIAADLLIYDELRLCDPKDVDQALERISHSEHKVVRYLSTCGLQNSDIHARFLEGTQHSFHSACGCPDGVNLALAFPDCVVADDPKHPEPYLRCPKCKWKINHPQNGRYVPYNDGADYNSYHVSQLISDYITTKEIWTAYKRTTNMEEFFNAKLGIPYVDISNRGVSYAEVLGCVNRDVLWREPNSRKEKGYTAMGVDQGAGYCVATIADNYGGKKRLRHVEIIEQQNPIYQENGVVVSPFNRLYELMKEYNVRICVVDGMPNFNDALSFAQAHPGRVWIAGYTDQEGAEVVHWTDKRYKQSVAKAGPMFRFKYSVQIARYQALSVLFAAWVAHEWVVPAPEHLVQAFRDRKTGILRPQSPAEVLMEELPKYIRRYRITDEETGKGRYEWAKPAGSYDHLTHALVYTTVALERLKKQPSFSFM